MMEAVKWYDQYTYDEAVEKARRANLPLLLDFYSGSSLACRQLEEATYSNEDVIRAIVSKTVPVRVHVEGGLPNWPTACLVSSHIFIMSQTVQLISTEGDIVHKFLGAPRHTRRGKGASTVHEDIPGHLPADLFLNQLDIGLAKADLFAQKYDRAEAQLLAIAKLADGLAQEEARYWLPIAASKGNYPESDDYMQGKARELLPREVERFCLALVKQPDANLLLDWQGSDGIGSWAGYTDCLREVALSIIQALVDLDIAVTAKRAACGLPLTQAQHILKHAHISYRELQGSMLGLTGSEVDRLHFGEHRSLGKQRTIRNNMVHCVLSEFWAHAPAIRSTLRWLRGGARAVSDATCTFEEYGEPPVNFGPLAELKEISEARHSDLIDEFKDITDQELDAPTGWWEPDPVTVRFRLNRLGWHLQDHDSVVETICERIGRVRSETERLTKRVYRALGAAEGSMIGLSAAERSDAFAEVTALICNRTKEVQRPA